ncbi:hypothetical protein [Aestuariicoccus sp. MJ-SS9]|uniref:hypothetical protein n=1 Tax=Aestuariicoccus sp. MJ-SS9 TaxID=3079855 RepID=UPI00290B5DAC|nr:hypothetical protein [Aestuariicoccus sp. MJ-SS9]MDU8913931.1 hypothetical protein [Aestuariicoccus sp. MJ-SS9]
MRSYEAARSLFSFLGFIAWVAIIFGSIAAFGGASAASQVRSFGSGTNGMAVILAAAPGVALVFFGFLGLAVVQIGRAGVDTAEYTQQMLKIARDQLEVSQQALTHGRKMQNTLAGLQAGADITAEVQASSEASYRKEPPVSNKLPQLDHIIGSTVEYKKKTIRVVEAGYEFAGTVYSSFNNAKAKIDEEAAYFTQPQSKPPNAEQLGVNPSAVSDTMKRG